MLTKGETKFQRRKKVKRDTPMNKKLNINQIIAIELKNIIINHALYRMKKILKTMTKNIVKKN